MGAARCLGSKAAYLTASIVGLIMATAAASSAKAALTVQGYQDKLHDRFYVGSDRDFIGESYDWSGVGRFDDPNDFGNGVVDVWKFVTMISDQWFIMANHNHASRLNDPGSPSPVRFYETNDPSGTYWESPVALDANGNYVGQAIANSDLWIGKLDSAPPSWVKRYPLIERPETFSYAGLDAISSTIFIVGQDTLGSYTGVRVGRNQINNHFEHAPTTLSPSSIATVEYQWTYDTGQAGLGTDEAQTEPGDSSGPSFAVTLSGLALAGTHTTTNGDTSMSYFANAIRQAVPEPVSTITDLPGDVDADFDVDSNDYNILALNYGQSNRTPNQGDINGDGTVDSADYSLLSLNYGKNLRSPADFNNNWVVDTDDFAVIGNHWMQSVTAHTNGDVDGDGVVNEDDINELNRTWSFGVPVNLPSPPIELPGDFNGNGLVDQFADYGILYQHYGQTVPPGTLGDMDGDGDVDSNDFSLFSLSLKPGGVADLDNDGKVINSDLAILIAAMGTSSPGSNYGADGDLNEDGVIDSADFAIMGEYWGLGITLSGLPLTPLQVPEPNMIGLIGLTLMAVLYVSRRHVQSKLGRDIWTDRCPAL